MAENLSFLFGADANILNNPLVQYYIAREKDPAEIIPFCVPYVPDWTRQEDGGYIFTVELCGRLILVKQSPEGELSSGRGGGSFFTESLMLEAMRATAIEGVRELISSLSEEHSHVCQPCRAGYKCSDEWCEHGLRAFYRDCPTCRVSEGEGQVA